MVGGIRNPGGIKMADSGQIFWQDCGCHLSALGLCKTWFICNNRHEAFQLRHCNVVLTAQ